MVTQLTRALPLEPMSARVKKNNCLLTLQNAVFLSKDPGRGLHDQQALGAPGYQAPSALGQFLWSLSFPLVPSHLELLPIRKKPVWDQGFLWTGGR